MSNINIYKQVCPWAFKSHEQCTTRFSLRIADANKCNQIKKEIRLGFRQVEKTFQ